jgi:hypothetical protein
VLASTEKELRSFFRSWPQLGYSSLITALGAVFLWLVYSSRSVSTVAPPLRQATNLASFVTLQFLLLTIWIRLIYPLFSLELRSAWLTAASPAGRKTIFGGKLLWTLLITVIFTALASLAIGFLPLQLDERGSFFILIWITSVVSAAITFFFSVIYPNLDEIDPASMSTSVGGLGATTLSLVVIVLSTLTLVIKPVGYFIAFLYLTLLIGLILKANRQFLLTDLTA